MPYKNKLERKFYEFKRNHGSKEHRDGRSFHVNFDFSFEEFEQKYKQTKGICKLCNNKFDSLSVDVNPPISKVKKGHIYRINDIQFLCRRCNSAKSNRTGKMRSFSISWLNGEDEFRFAWIVVNSEHFTLNNYIKKYRWSPYYRFMNKKGGWYQSTTTEYSPYYVPSCDNREEWLIYRGYKS
jgi:5-methylcytosine-specific restriction endonuclease McrA